MSKLINTLEQLHMLRLRAVDELKTRLSSQQRHCQHFESNIATLTSLAEGVSDVSENSAVLMSNHSGYKRNIQRVIDWQKQEQMLANLEMKKLQGALLVEAKKEKGIEMVLDDRKRAQKLEHQRNEQKNIDAVSAQCWLRQKLANG